MNSDQEWAHNELLNLIKNSSTYEEQSFYRALDRQMTEQAHRLTIAKGELDGRSWADK